MKTLTLSIFVVLLFSFILIDQNTKQDDVTNSGLLLNPESRDLNLVSETTTENPDIDGGWYEKALEHIQKEEYNISFDETSCSDLLSKPINIRISKTIPLTKKILL